MERSIVEYFRALPGIGRFVGNNVYFYTMGNMNIYHGYTNLTWYEYTGVRCFTNFKTYPYNKKRLIKGTILEYAPLKEFQEYFYNVNFLEAIQYGAYESFELLWKLKLYNLSLYANKLNQKGSFYSRFKVPKNFLKYMQENNIEYWQLNRLRLFKDYKIKDIEPLINEYVSFNFLKLLKKENAIKEGVEFLKKHFLEYYSIKDFKEITKIVPLRKALMCSISNARFFQCISNIIANFKHIIHRFIHNLYVICFHY